MPDYFPSEPFLDPVPQTNFQPGNLDRIAALIDRIHDAVSSPENKARLCRISTYQQPNVIFSFEEPMTWVRLWNLDTARYYMDPYYYIENILEQKLWRWENFPDDNLPITAEIPASLSMYPEYTFLGMGLYFSPEGIPTIQNDHPLTRTPDLSLLTPVNFQTSGWMPRLLRWWDDLNRIIAGRIKVVNTMTWWRGCLDLAVQLRGYDQFILDIAERPAFVHDLLKFLTEQRCYWWEAYNQHFNLPLMPSDIGEDWLNVPFISPYFFRDFVLPRYLEIEAFHGGIRSLHSCGNQAPLQQYFLEIKSLSNYEVSPWTSLVKSLENLPVEKKLAIGLHPNDVLFTTPQEMETRLRGIREACAGRSYDIGTSGLTPIFGTSETFIRQVNVWLDIVHAIF
jgi:hypothetical protein